MLSKPGWIKFLGWLSLAFMVTPLGWRLGEWVSGGAYHNIYVPGLAFAGFVVTFVIWLLASIMFHIMSYNAKLKAAAMKPFIEAMQRGPVENRPPAAGPGTPPTPPFDAGRHLIPRVEEKK